MTIGLLAAATITATAAGVVELGPIEVVLRDGAEGLHYFPDGPVVVLDQSPRVRALVVAGQRTELLEGADFKSLKRLITTLSPGGKGDFDNGYAGIFGAWRLPSGEWLAVYHGEDHEDMKPIRGGIPGFYCRVGLATSRDGGRTFQKLGPAVGGRVTKNPGGLPDQGDGEPCLISEAAREWLYLYYTSHERSEGRGVDICLARAPITRATEPAAWKKYRGGEFSEPGLGGKDSPVLTGGAGADALMPHVVYEPAWKQYLMTFCVNAWGPEARRAGRSGIYLATSTDGVNWPPSSVRQIWRTPTVAVIGAEVAWHPMLLLDEPAHDGSLRGWLYFGYSANWGHTPPQVPHALYRRSIQIPVARERNEY